MNDIKCNKCIWFKKIRKDITGKYLPKTIFICTWQDVWYLRPEGSKKLSKNKNCNFIIKRR